MNNIKRTAFQLVAGLLIGLIGSFIFALVYLFLLKETFSQHILAAIYILAIFFLLGDNIFFRRKSSGKRPAASVIILMWPTLLAIVFLAALITTNSEVFSSRDFASQIIIAFCHCVIIMNIGYLLIREYLPLQKKFFELESIFWKKKQYIPNLISFFAGVVIIIAIIHFNSEGKSSVQQRTAAPDSKQEMKIPDERESFQNTAVDKNMDMHHKASEQTVFDSTIADKDKYEIVAENASEKILVSDSTVSDSTKKNTANKTSLEDSTDKKEFESIKALFDSNSKTQLAMLDKLCAAKNGHSKLVLTAYYGRVDSLMKATLHPTLIARLISWLSTVEDDSAIRILQTLQDRVYTEPAIAPFYYDIEKAKRKIKYAIN